MQAISDCAHVAERDAPAMNGDRQTLHAPAPVAAERPLEPLLIDLHTVCRLVSLSPATIHRLIAASHFPRGGYPRGLEPTPDERGRVKGGRLLWRLDVVRRWVEENYANPAGTAG
jgi:hypothetical protein